MTGTVRQGSLRAVAGCGLEPTILLNYPANYSAPVFRFADFNARDGTPAAVTLRSECRR